MMIYNDLGWCSSPQTKFTIVVMTHSRCNMSSNVFSHRFTGLQRVGAGFILG